MVFGDARNAFSIKKTTQNRSKISKIFAFGKIFKLPPIRQTPPCDHGEVWGGGRSDLEKRYVYGGFAGKSTLCGDPRGSENL